MSNVACGPPITTKGDGINPVNPSFTFATPFFFVGIGGVVGQAQDFPYLADETSFGAFIFVRQAAARAIGYPIG